MTYDDDMLELNFPNGPLRLTCAGAGVSWPPPDEFEFVGTTFKRVSMSEITDEQRGEMDFLIRGARYEVAHG